MPSLQDERTAEGRWGELAVVRLPASQLRGESGASLHGVKFARRVEWRAALSGPKWALARIGRDHSLADGQRRQQCRKIAQCSNPAAQLSPDMSATTAWQTDSRVQAGLQAVLRMSRQISPVCKHVVGWIRFRKPHDTFKSKQGPGRLEDVQADFARLQVRGWLA